MPKQRDVLCFAGQASVLASCRRHQWRSLAEPVPNKLAANGRQQSGEGNMSTALSTACLADICESVWDQEKKLVIYPADRREN
ncbi:Protein of unknown function [Gryllus bimaculatus]|nr:Protein of unknown function [Gryllus bimaculatus]